MPSIPTKTIENTTSQLIQINYQSIDSTKSVTDVPAAKSGVLHIKPNTQVIIEAERINDGQLANISETDVRIKVTDGLLST